MIRRMKTLLLGIAFIILIGIGGLVYRNAVEFSQQKINCPIERFVCPDGTELVHEGLTCDFPACPPPNVTLGDVGIGFAVPSGFTSRGNTAGVVAAYEAPIASTSEMSTITIRRFPIEASSTALTTIEKTAINLTADLPVSPARFSSITLGGRTFTVVPVDRFEGVVDTAYYLARPSDVLRFDAIDRGVDWTNPNLDVTTLPAHASLLKMLATLQAQGGEW